MKGKQRALLVVLIVGLPLIAGLVFWQFVLANLVLPLATMTWLALRIFVLSIDQQVYWWGLILLAAVLALIRAYQGSLFVSVLPSSTYPPSSWDRVRIIRESILRNVHQTGEENSFKQELMWMFTSMYSSQQQGYANYQIREAFESRKMPLPEPIYKFLFSKEPLAPKRPFLRRPATYMQRRLKRWLDQRSGREATAYYRSIDEVLTYMERTLEVRNDEDPHV